MLVCLRNIIIFALVTIQSYANSITFYASESKGICPSGLDCNPFVVAGFLFNMQAIYKISSKIKPERIYVGSAVNYKNRKGIHRSMLKGNSHPNTILQNHAKKYGTEDLYFEILELIMFKEDLIIREQFYSDTLKPYFNIRKIASSNLGLIYSEKTKQKMRIKQTKVYLTFNNKTKPLIEWAKIQGIKISTIRNRIYRGWTIEQALKRRQKSKINITKKKEPTYKGKSIIQYDLEWNVITIYESITLASKKTGVSRTSIANNLSKLSKIAGGYIWKYQQKKSVLQS